MFDRLGRWAVRYPGKICVAWLALAVGLTAVAPNWRSQAQDDDVRFLSAITHPRDETRVEVRALLSQT